jgi:hypothetical protein
MDGIISYTDQIKKFISGKEYAGKNIQTSDGVVSYITKTGIAKPYNTPLSNKNGCTTAIERIDSKFGNMGISVGSLMAKGQSCGNETSYVQSLPPKTTFDWKFYIDSNPDLHLTTEQQANDHWKSAGIHQGLLPNSTILSSMTNVGKIGYVDINTTLHAVPKESHAYTGTYKIFSEGNVTGSDMSDCTVPPPSIKYGDQVCIKYGNLYASMNEQSYSVVGENKTNFYLRPPSFFSVGAPIKYGDLVSLAVSSSNSKTPDCGWWGCKVAYVNDQTKVLSFGPGGETSKLFELIAPPGTNYKYGSEIKYGNPFTLMSSMQLGYMWDGVILFAAIDSKYLDKVTFTFETPDNSKYVAACDIDALQTACNLDNTCTGFIHSNKDNTWQKMTTNSTEDMYKVTDTSPDVYLRNAYINMNDKSCNKGVSEFIDSDTFIHYPKGKDFVMNGDQCSAGLNTYEITQKQQLYNQSNKIANKTGEQMVKTYPNVSGYSTQINSIYNNLNSNTNEYKSVLNTIQKKREQYNDTYNQQNMDLALLENSNKNHVFAWGLSSIFVIAMVVMLKNRQ